MLRTSCSRRRTDRRDWIRPDLSFLSEVRLRLDPAIEASVALAPLIDPNEHSCGTVRPHGARELVQEDRGLYLELELPETGVCTRVGVEGGAAASGSAPPASTPAAYRTPTPRPSGRPAADAPEVGVDRQLPVILALGTTQTLAWGSSYYLPAILADPISRDLGISSNWFFAAFSASLVLSGLLGPRIGRQIDRVGGRQVLSASNIIPLRDVQCLGHRRHCGCSQQLGSC
jgi:hypothetical protein